MSDEQQRLVKLRIMADRAERRLREVESRTARELREAREEWNRATIEFARLARELGVCQQCGDPEPCDRHPEVPLGAVPVVREQTDE